MATMESASAKEEMRGLRGLAYQTVARCTSTAERWGWRMVGPTVE